MVLRRAPTVRRILVALLLLIVPFASGCLDAPAPIYVANSHLPSGWEHTTVNDTTETANGAVDIVLNSYKKDTQTTGEVHLVAATNVPFVDESEQLEKQANTIAGNDDVTLTRTGTTSRTLANGANVDIIEYDIEKQTVAGTFRGKAWLLSFDTDGFAGGGFAYATTEYEGVLGKQTDTGLWDEAKQIALHSDW